MYRAHPSWFMDIDGQRKEMIEYNAKINWFPEHIKHGRSEKTMESAPDWNLSRDRFWATPMPVWQGQDKDGKTVVKIVGSYAELEELSGVKLDDYHRPWVDDVKFTIDKVTYSRIEKVMDSWFESGSMPFAQFHYPFENKQKFEDNYPADFIVEYVPQVRAWFYYMHAVSIGLFDRNAFSNAIVHGTLAGNDGRKMSKSYGNYTDPNELMDTYSADALRFLFLSSTLLNGEDYSLLDKNVADVNRKLAMVWNMYDFFTMYAEVDNWEWDGKLDDPSDDLDNQLDEWIVSRVHSLITEVETHMKIYDLPNALKPILPFIDDASNWYVRRSRKRFWKTEDDKDKNNAYRTLHYVLVKLAHVLAPFTPFLAEELYIKLTDGVSVHLNDWPASGKVNQALIDEMAYARELVTAGLALRAKNQIKVRQPLAVVTVSNSTKLTDSTIEMIIEELNVKKLSVSDKTELVELDLDLTKELILEGLSREIIRHIQAARKDAKLNVDDRIKLSLKTEDEQLLKSIKQHSREIQSETLATTISEEKYSYDRVVKISTAKLTISLEK
jgi:isoleucyl-tRNA synthetase